MESNEPIDVVKAKDYLVQSPALLPRSVKTALRIIAARHGTTSSQLVRYIILQSVGTLYPEYAEIHKQVLQEESIEDIFS